MRVNIDTILEKQGKTRYWLAKEAGYSYPNLMKLCNGETESVKFEVLEGICKALDCSLNDILIIE